MPVALQISRAVEQLSNDVGSTAVELTTLAGGVQALSMRAKVRVHGYMRTIDTLSCMARFFHPASALQ